MPQIIVAIVALVGLTITTATATAILINLAVMGASLLFGAISKMFAKGSSASSLTSEMASRTVTSRQAIAPWRVCYGANRLGGIITFLHITGATNDKLHIVITLAGHEVNAITAMYFDGVAVPLNGSGDATGNFAGFVHAEFNLGTRGQATFPGLLAAAPAFWTAAHRQRGRAGVYVRLTWDQNKFPNGVPNITFDVQGRKVYDPRAGTIAYSNNAALCIADYLNNASFGLVAQTKYPLASSMLSNAGFSNYTAANFFDGNVATNAFGNNTTTSGSWIGIDLGSGNPQEFRRCRFYVSTAGQTQQYNIQYSDDNWVSAFTAGGPFLPDAIGWNEIELAPNGAHRYWRLSAINTVTQAGFCNEVEFYISDVDSTQLISAANTCDEAVSILPSGTQNRFDIDGSFDTSEAPSAVVGRMNSAMAGSVLYTAGKWGIYPGIWRTPTISLTDADFRGPMTVQTRLTHRDLYNGVKGTFISPTNNWQISDYPPFQSAAYLQEDNNESLWLDVELPFTINGAMAQRLSKIALRRVRHQITVQAQFKLTAYQIQPLDVVNLSHPRFGWVNKTFEVTACTLTYSPDSSGAPALGVDLTLREADSTIYDWTTADEIALNAPPTTVLPNNAVCQPPTGLTISAAEIVRIVDGVKTSGLAISWTSPADQFVLSGGHIIVQYKKNSDLAWKDVGKLDGGVTNAQIIGVTDGVLYNVRIWAENSSGVESSIVSANATPTGTVVATSSGKNMLINPGFEANDVGTPLNTNLAANAMVSNDWKLENLDAYHTAQLATSFPRSGANAMVLRVANGVTIPSDGLAYQIGAKAQSKLYLSIGDIVRVSGWVLPVAGATPPAGVTRAYDIGIAFYDSTGIQIGQLNAEAFTFPGFYVPLQGAIEVPATIGGGVPAYCRAQLLTRIVNSSGSPFSTGATSYGDVWFDDIKVVVQSTAFDLTPINTSGHATAPGGALSQSGVTTTINVASRTLQYGDGQVTYSAGSVNPGALGTYFVYADDPTYSGGAVTYIATLNESDVYAANGRIFFGKITTTGGGSTVSSAPPGSGGGRLSLL